jgi:hypothetical protein
MAGSDFYKRTEKAQDKYAPETADSKTMVLSISDFGNGAWAWGGEDMAQL